ncbi:hypothetical protein Y600_5935 [Burkholderia pseudomallei MSHR3709]|nr:hypothetical protein Y600_5935 [Burkholderia pseudomallei MSHR3709]
MLLISVSRAPLLSWHASFLSLRVVQIPCGEGLSQGFKTR